MADLVQKVNHYGFLALFFACGVCISKLQNVNADN